jgi:hypothetical protein
MAVSACSTTPTVVRENTLLTPAQIAEMGLICRRDTPPDSNIPRTICASESAWAAFDDERRKETDDILAEGRKHANVGRFNRD